MGAALRFVAERLSPPPGGAEAADPGVRRPTGGHRLLRHRRGGRPAGHPTGVPAKGYSFVAAAIGDDKENMERIYGDSFLDITDLNQLPVKLTQVVKRFLRV